MAKFHVLVKRVLIHMRICEVMWVFHAYAQIFHFSTLGLHSLDPMKKVLITDMNSYSKKGMRSYPLGLYLGSCYTDCVYGVD